MELGPQESRDLSGSIRTTAPRRAGLAKATMSESGNELNISFDPPIVPGRRVNIVFRGFNPKANIYQWATSLIPAGDDPITRDGPTRMLSVYRNIDYR